MLGYAFGYKAGLRFTGLFYHKGFAARIYTAGHYLSVPLCPLAGAILFSHAVARLGIGYGLKCIAGFKYTHLGEIGN